MPRNEFRCNTLLFEMVKKGKAAILQRNSRP